MVMATLILFLYLLYNSSAKGYCLDKYIIGGNPADIQDFPYQVSIQRNDSSHFCGGAVITEKFIITAAHCVCFVQENFGFPKDILTIFVGSTKLSGKGQTYSIEYTVCHSGFNMKDVLHDIGLIGVKNKIIFNKNVKPISILRNNIPVGTMLTVSGWGHISHPKIVRPDTLQMLVGPVISLEECKKAFKHAKWPVQDSHVCTFLKMNEGLCHGDSGGPLVLNGMLVGIVSWMKFCAEGKPDVNTKVSRYIKWIKSTITEYCKIRTSPTKNVYPKFVSLKIFKRLYKKLSYYRK